MSTESQVGTVKVEFASNQTAVVALVGEHDLHSRPALRATLAYAAEGRNVVVDLSRCSFVDSAIISLLLATQRTLKTHERPLRAGHPAGGGLRHPPLRDQRHLRALPRAPSRKVGFASMAAPSLALGKTA